MTETIPELIITLLLGGGLLKGIEALYRAYADNKEKQRLANVVGAKAPSEIESLSITTMSAALQSAEGRIKSLVAEKTLDQASHDETYNRMKAHIKVLEGKVDRLQKQNLELLSINLKEGGKADG